MELFRLLCQSQCLAVSFRMCHAKIGFDVLLCRVSFALSDDGHRRAVEARNARTHGMIFAVQAVTVQFYEVCEDFFYNIVNVRALNVVNDGQLTSHCFLIHSSHLPFLPDTRAETAGTSEFASSRRAEQSHHKSHAPM